MAHIVIHVACMADAGDGRKRRRTLSAVVALLLRARDHGGLQHCTNGCRHFRLLLRCCMRGNLKGPAAEPSLRSYVAMAQTCMGTGIMFSRHYAAATCMMTIHEMGAPRVSSSLRLGTRTDKRQTLEDKLRSIREKQHCANNGAGP